MPPPEWHFNLGAAHFRLKEWALARACYEKALEVAPPGWLHRRSAKQAIQAIDADNR